MSSYTPNGSIWFTDPGYGILSDYEGHVDKFELPADVYRLDPASGDVIVAASDFARPNGLCFSPDEKRLYIVDTGQPPGKPHPIRVFDVVDGRQLANGRMFCDMGAGGSDGIRCDVDGNVWAAAGWGGDGYDGVHVFAPDGQLIGKIRLPETCANLCFGGARRNRLFMTASQSLYALYVNTQGCSSTLRSLSCPRRAPKRLNAESLPGRRGSAAPRRTFARSGGARPLGPPLPACFRNRGVRLRWHLDKDKEGRTWYRHSISRDSW